jgi:Fe-S cluster assembly iron-binding protein IscA
MLTVTDRAAEFLRESLTRRGDGMPEALRIVYTEEQGYQLTLDNPKDGDQVFAQEGESFLLLDAELNEVLGDAIIDLQDAPQGPRITLTTNKTPARRPAEEETEGEPPSEDTPKAKARASKAAAEKEKADS